MSVLDSMSFDMPIEAMKSINDLYFKTSKILIGDNQIAENKTLNVNKLGIEKLVINRNRDIISIKVNSKILGLNYPQGFCLNTLEQVIDEINTTGIVLNKDFFNDVMLKSCDLKNDIILDDTISKYITSLNHLTAPKLRKTLYPSGIVFQGITAKSVRTTFYCKSLEIKNSLYNKIYPQMKDYFNNCLRMESRFITKEKIIQHFDSNNIIDILNTKDINNNILKKIIGNQLTLPKLFDTFSMTNAEEKKFCQAKYLHEQYKGDYKMAAQHIKNKLGRNTKASTQMQDLNKYYNIINNSKCDFLQSCINEILYKLIE